MFKTLQNVCELLDQNLHNLYTNKHKNLCVKKPMSPYIHFFTFTMNNNLFFTFIHQLNNTSYKVSHLNQH